MQLKKVYIQYYKGWKCKQVKIVGWRERYIIDEEEEKKKKSLFYYSSAFIKSHRSWHNKLMIMKMVYVQILQVLIISYCRINF